jgi:hypothetical protein
MSGDGCATPLGTGLAAAFSSLLCYASIRWRKQLAAMAVEYRLSLRGLLPRRIREPLTRWSTAPAVIRAQMVVMIVLSGLVALCLWLMFFSDVGAVLRGSR